MQTAVEQLYAVFARYPLRTPIDSCPCCRGPEYTGILETKLLRELDEEDLMQYAGSAMTTIGDVDDFRHFLPRVFELLSQDRYYSPEIALGKLNIGEWRSWPADEQLAIEEYLREAWTWARQEPFVEADAWLCGIARVVSDLDPYLEAWRCDVNTQAQSKLADFVAMAPELSDFWEEIPHQLKLVQSWISNLSAE